MFQLKYLSVALLVFGSLAINSSHAGTLQAMTDQQLSNTTGQALMSLSYIAPTDAANLERQRGGDQNIGFYKLGMEAEVELNANIKKLQLGCGGANGAGACDIDIDNLSLSGLADTNTGRASSSAKMTNPFIEFAIRNPNSASTREFVGIRLSAEKLQGLLTTGTANSDVANGINTLSGYLKVQSGIGSTLAEQSKIKGYADTAFQYMNLATYPIAGRLVALGVADASFVTIGGGFNIPEMNNLPFERSQLTVVGNRKTSISLQASVDIPTIYLGNDDANNYPSLGRTTENTNGTTTAVYTAGSPVNAKITGCDNVYWYLPACIAAPTGRQFSGIKMSGSVSGAKAMVNFKQALGFIHSLQINSSASLSLQKIALRWTGAEAENIAEPGWWLAMQDPVNLGRIEPQNRLPITPLLGQFATKAGEYLQAHPATTSDFGAVISGSGLDADIGPVDLSKTSPLQMDLANLPLKGQDFAPNCYGSLKFC